MAVVRASTLTERLIASGGETGALIASHDWSSTSLGPIETWPQSLRIAAELMLGAKQPVYLAWGPELVSLYNDGYLPIVGAKHPGVGLPFSALWAEIWEEFRPLVEATMAGEAQHFVDRPIALAGRPDRPVGWFTFSYTPLRDEAGAIAGFYCAATETTDKVLAEQRRAVELEHQRRMFSQAPGFICTLEGPDHVFTFVNKAHERLFGDRGLVGKSVREGFPELDGQGFYELLDRVYATGERHVAQAAPARLRTGEGFQDRFLDFVYEPMLDAEGRVFGVFCEGFDVTDAHQAQDALRLSEERLRFLDELAEATQPLTDPAEVMAVTARLLGEHLAVAVCAYADMDADQDGFTIRGDWTAPGAASIVGSYALASFGPTAVRELRAGRPFVTRDTLAELGPEEAALFLELGLKATVCMPLVKEGRLTALMAVHAAETRDWSQPELALVAETVERSWAHVERVGAEAALRTSEARYRQLFETIDEGFCVVQLMFDATGRPVDYRFVEANPAFPRHTGLVDAVGRTARDVIPGLEPHWFEIYGRVALTGEAVRFENFSEVMGRWFDVHASRIGPPEARRVAILFNDVTARRRAEEALRELNHTLERRVAEALSERKLLADIVEGTDAFVQVAGPDYRWLAINKAAADEFERIFGVRPKVGDSMLDIIAHLPEHQAAVRAVWSRALAGEEFTEVGEFGDPDRDRRFYEMKYNTLRDADGRLIGAYQFVYDVTQRMLEQERLLTAEEALRQSQKMEAMGQLTGGVAHDFNNLLTPIVGALDMLQRRGVGGEREQRLIAGAMQSAERAKTLVQRLLAFARRQPLQPSAVDIGKLVNGMGDLIASTTGPQIRVVVEAAGGLPAAKADPNQLEMALLNLAVNARDAMPEGGTLRISASAETVGAPRRSRLRSGAYVKLSVADTGLGMDEATLARAVEPFFSTKGVGKGTGLGLSMVHGLAEQLGGALTIQSRPGFGTNVELWLPQSADAPEKAQSIMEAPAGPVERGTALLVDDEELVRLSTADMLGDLGYAVTEVASAEEAMRLVHKGERFDLLVTDHLMPGMTGADLARAVRAARPGVPVLVVSGYAESDGVEPELPRLTKPFRKDELASSLAQLSTPA